MGLKSASPSIVFFGTGPVAAKSLELLAKNFTVEAVITKPRPAHHRGDTPVIDIAEKLNVPVFTASTKAEIDELFSQKPVNSELGVLIDFGIIVSQKIIDYFPLGIINSHFSILPDLRGADPITFAILSGQKQTGVSIMQMVAAMDEGPLVGYGEYDLPNDITTPELTEYLIQLSDALLANEIPRIFSGETREGAHQDVTGRKVSYSRRLSKADGEIDWKKSAIALEREIRAFLGWPGSYTTIAGKEVTITKAHAIDATGTPGKILSTKKKLSVSTADGGLAIDRIKPAGKNEMDIVSFIAGYGKNLL